jgi:hypothetical protein
MKQIGCERWQLIILARRPAIFDNYIPAFEVTGFAQTFAERTHPVRQMRQTMQR